MSDGSSFPENQIRAFKNKFLRTLAGVGLAAGTTVAGGAALQQTVEAISSPNQFQQIAGQLFDNPKIKKTIFKVVDDPDVRQVGLAARNTPIIPEKSEPPNEAYRLKPNDTFTGVSADELNIQDLSRSPERWVAYKDEQGKIRFVNAQYLKPVEAR